MLSRVSKLVLVVVVCAGVAYGFGLALGAFDWPDPRAVTRSSESKSADKAPLVEAMAPEDCSPDAKTESTSEEPDAAAKPSAEVKEPKPNKTSPDVLRSAVGKSRTARKPKAHVATGYNENPSKEVPVDRLFTPLRPEDRW